MTQSPHPTETGERRVVVVGKDPNALELAFRLRFKLGPKTTILLVPEGRAPSFEPWNGASPVRSAPDRS